MDILLREQFLEMFVLIVGLFIMKSLNAFDENLEDRRGRQKKGFVDYENKKKPLNDMALTNWFWRI